MGIEPDQDKLQPIISAYWKALHVSFPKLDLSAAFTIHKEKADINQRLFFLYFSTPTYFLDLNGLELGGGGEITKMHTAAPLPRPSAQQT